MSGELEPPKSPLMTVECPRCNVRVMTPYTLIDMQTMALRKFTFQDTCPKGHEFSYKFNARHKILESR